MARNRFHQSDATTRFARACAWLALSLCAPAFAALETNPTFPSYRDNVALQLSDVGPEPWVPATRYRRNGNSIILEMENLRGGYFGPRRDMQYLPVPVGELAPGTYALQAKLYDMADLDAPALLFSRTLEVAPPDAVGVYSVPRSPGSLEPFELLVRADGPIDASSMRVTVSGTNVRIDFSYAGAGPAYATVKVAGLIPALYHVEAYGSDGYAGSLPHRFNGDVNVTNTRAVVEYYAPTLGHYFVSTWPDEIAALDAGTAFLRTGQKFNAWLRAADAPAAAVPVCRFYASGPNSHFYTADANECQMLKSLEQKQKAESQAKGMPFPGWQFEAIAFYALAPENGSCPAGTTPVYRFYNNRAAQNDSNHRFTVTQPIRFAMSQDWIDEGVAFCSPA